MLSQVTIEDFDILTPALKGTLTKGTETVSEDLITVIYERIVSLWVEVGYIADDDYNKALEFLQDHQTGRMKKLRGRLTLDVSIIALVGL